jgi:hypothetical protein
MRRERAVVPAVVADRTTQRLLVRAERMNSWWMGGLE